MVKRPLVFVTVAYLKPEGSWMACTVAPITSSLVSCMITFPLRAEVVTWASIVNAEVNIMAMNRILFCILINIRFVFGCKIN